MLDLSAPLLRLSLIPSKPKVSECLYCAVCIWWYLLPNFFYHDDHAVDEANFLKWVKGLSWQEYYIRPTRGNFKLKAFKAIVSEERE